MPDLLQIPFLNKIFPHAENIKRSDYDIHLFFYFNYNL